jgi:hypothetical protein
MPFTPKTDSVLLEASFEDAKLVYRTLHRHLRENLDLMDCELLDDLQSALQEKAQAEGVDIAHHSAWDLWLGNTDIIPCEERVKRREVL